MIDWNKTLSKYNYDRDSIKCHQKVILVCIQCNKESESQWRPGRESILNNKLCKPCTSSKLWKDDEYAKNVKKGTSDWAINNNIRPDFDSSKAAKIGWSRLNYRNKISENTKKSWQNNEYREIHREAMSRYWTPERRKEFGEWSKKMWETKEYKNKFSVGRSKMKLRPSRLEKIFSDILDQLGLEFQEQYVIGPYSFDFMVQLNKPLLIDVHGNYWHMQDKIIRRDVGKATYYNNYLSRQYDFKTVWEHEFGCVSRLKDLLKYWSGIKEDIIDFDIKSCIIDNVDRNVATSFIALHHYIGKIGIGDIIYGIFVGAELAAVVVFSRVTRKESADRLGLKTNEIRELSRLAIHPKYQKKNFASHIISKAVKLIKNDSGLKCLIAFADSSFNHNGTVYKASGWKHDGYTKSDYWYAAKDGWIMHKKTLYQQAKAAHMIEKEFADRFEYKKIVGEPKHRYILWIQI